MTQRIYMRVSTVDKQDFLRQEYLLKEKGYDFEKCVVYEEKISGKTRKRPQLEKLLSELESGDNLIVTDLTRLARSVRDLLAIGEEITDKNANLISLKENIDLETSTGKLLFTVIGAIGQFERDVLSDRTKEALKAKKQKGIKLGRPTSLDESIIEQSISEYMSTNKSMLVVSKEFGISNATLCKELKKRGMKR